jgi:hypothetical protein
MAFNKKKETKTFYLTLLISFFIGCTIGYLIIIPKHMQEEIIPRFYVNFAELSFDLKKYLSNSSDVLKEKLFPWLYNIQNDYNSSLYAGEKNTKGIVICTGNRHFDLALVALKALQILENELPIEVVYSTSNDLSLNNQKILKKIFPNIRLIDLSLMAFNDSYLKLRGWEIKPFAVLASRFEQVILMDADVLFFEKPEILFKNKYFIQTGTLFFYDRPNLRDDIIKLIQTFSSNNSQPLPMRTQESGVVLIDKSRVLFGLLSICKLNDYHERKRVTYVYLYGDKDTWWLGLHIINMPYSFLPTMPAAIGQIIKKKNKTMVCGRILHFDENNKLIWWNGGMLKEQVFGNNNLLQIDGWLEEGEWKSRPFWCLTNNKQTPRQFNSNQQQLINEYRRITKEILKIS